MHIIALSEAHGIPLTIYNNRDKNNPVVKNKPQKLKYKKPMILVYDEENEGHYSFCEMKDDVLLPKKFLVDKNNCLFACFDYYLTGEIPTAKGIEKLRNDAAGYLETGPRKELLSALYCQLEKHQALLKGGGTKRRLVDDSDDVHGTSMDRNPYKITRPQFPSSTKSAMPVTVAENERPLDRRHGLHFDKCIRQPFQKFIDTVFDFEGNQGLNVRLSAMIKNKSLQDTLGIRQQINVLVKAFNSDKNNLVVGYRDANKGIENTRGIINRLLEKVNKGQLSPENLKVELAQRLKPNTTSSISAFTNEHIELMLSCVGSHEEFCEFLKDVSITLTLDIAHESTTKDFNQKTLENYLTLQKLLRNLEKINDVSFERAKIILDEFQQGFLDIYLENASPSYSASTRNIGATVSTRSSENSSMSLT